MGNSFEDVSLCKDQRMRSTEGNARRNYCTFIIATKNSTVNVDYKVKSVKLRLVD